MMSDERIRLGTVDVDSGQLIVIDPCYVGRLTDDFYEQVCSVNQVGLGGQVNYGRASRGLAVTFHSGFGDGTYSVYATISDRRVVKVEIDLDPDDEAEESW